MCLRVLWVTHDQVLALLLHQGSDLFIEGAVNIAP